jgi:hypothetical protein
MGEQVTLETFEPHVGSQFQLDAGFADLVDIRLVEAVAAPERFAKAGFGRAPFSITFRGPVDVRLSQRTYTITHPQLGAMDIFLVPIQPDEQGPLYEAAFS